MMPGGQAAAPLRTPDFLLAGYEQGGTTLLSDLFRANGFESGFECGVLLGRSPAEMRNIAPFWDRLLTDWNLSRELRDQAAAGSFPQFYDLLFRHAFPDFARGFFDKTPRYMERLTACLHRAPFLKGAVIVHRDPRAVFVSMARKIAPGEAVAATVERHFAHLTFRYLSYFAGCAGHFDNPAVLFVSFRDLVLQTDSLRRIGSFVGGRPFDPVALASRFAEVAPGGMDPRRITEFRHLLPLALQRRILEHTATAAPFFLEEEERAHYAPHSKGIIDLADTQLKRCGRARGAIALGGVVMDPLAYLLRYPDLLVRRADPVRHFLTAGRFEGRIP